MLLENVALSRLLVKHLRLRYLSSNHLSALAAQTSYYYQRHLSCQRSIANIHFTKIKTPLCQPVVNWSVKWCSEPRTKAIIAIYCLFFQLIHRLNRRLDAHPREVTRFFSIPSGNGRLMIAWCLCRFPLVNKQIDDHNGNRTHHRE